MGYMGQGVQAEAQELPVLDGLTPAAKSIELPAIDW